MRRLLVLFFLLIFFAACNRNGASDGIIPEDEMVDVLVDMHLADAYTATLIDTPKIVEIYKTVYKHHGIDSLSFRKSLEFYTKEPKVLKEMYKEVNEKITALQLVEKKKEEKRLKEQQKRDKKFADSLNRIAKRFTDSVRKDSIKKATAKKLQLKKDSLKLDSIKKAKLTIRKKDSLKRDSIKKAKLEKLRLKKKKSNGIPPKRS